MFMAMVCDFIDSGRIITIDVVDRRDRPQHNRITYLHGSSTSEGIVTRIQSKVEEKDKIMVVLDSDHSKEHVLNELRIYSQFVTRGGYLVVEDTNINGHPIYPGFGPGPMEAIEEFLNENRNFVRDRSMEKLLLTFCPNGYLKKIN